MKQLTLRLPDDLHHAIRMLAYDSLQSCNEIAIAALRKYLEQMKK